MWLLTHEGSLTEEKRLWLRPGTSHLLGRGNHATDFRIFVDAKSVSRKHLVIEVRPGSSSSPSEIVLRDSSKFGTHLDGEKFVEAEKVVRPEVGKVRWEIRLGNWAVAWRLEWHPVTVTMSGGAKKKAKAAVSATLESRLEALDIKIVRDYVPTRVTHVVAAKRNTPKGLQALVEGKHVVSEAFVDALEKVTAKCEVVVDAEGKEKLPRAPLEEDFDGNWPDEMDYVPDPSNESVERPVELYAPSSERASVFAGYTFIFCDEAQFDQLAPVVTLGNGKALLRELETGSDDVESFVRYAKDVAGEKGLGEFEDGSEGKGVVVVRISQPRGQDEEWYVRFYRDIDLELGQRSINQNEFLDAIVINDASALRQPLQPAAEDDVPPSSIPGPPPSTSVAASQFSVPSREMQGAQSMPPPSTAKKAPPSSQSPVSNTTRRGFRRALTVSRFKGFDDFDPSEISKTQRFSDDNEIKDAATSQAEPPQASMANTQTHERATRGKKRQHEDQAAIEISDDEGNKRTMDKLLPAAAAMKRRKLEQKLQNPEKETTSEAPESPRKPSLVLPSALRKLKQEDTEEIDVRQLAKERREKEEEQRQKEEEAFREAMEGFDAESMEVVPTVEEMEIRPRTGRAGNADGEDRDDERWKPEWNGRKNFKKFRKRRPGEQDGELQAPIRSRRVIVPVEEAETGTYSFKDSFWRDTTRSGEGRDHISRPPERPNRISSRTPLPENAEVIPVDDDDDDGGDIFIQEPEQRNTGPVSSIALRLDDDAEMHDLDLSEIAGVPRSQSIAALAKQAQTKLSSSAKSRPGTARAASPTLISSQSQTLAGDSMQPHNQQRPGSSGSMASSTGTMATRTTRGGTKRGAMGPPEEEDSSRKQKRLKPGEKKAPPPEKKQLAKKPASKPKKVSAPKKCGIAGGNGGQVMLGRGLGSASNDEDEDEDDDDDGLKFRRRR